MIKSMTGYGSSKGTVSGFIVNIDLKSVNNRYLETSVRLPRNFMFMEDALKKTVQDHISRGKVDVYVSIDSSEVGNVSVKVNKPLVNEYMNAIKIISEQTGLPFDITSYGLARLPDILTTETSEYDSEEICSGITALLNEALTDFDNMRQTEGEKLKNDVSQRLSLISEYVNQIEAKAPETVSGYKDKLERKIREVLEDKNVDENRIIQEVAIFADHIAVDEETVRLRSHIEQLRNMISNTSPIGRKIDFLVQEFNREANTIGSKCQNSELAHIVVDMKSEIEKIREQIQNIE